MKIVKIENNLKNILDVEFVLGNVCNYKCHYCFPGCNEGTHRWPEHEIIIKNIKSLFQYYQLNGKELVDLKIIGGEPTLWPYLEYFVSEIKKSSNVFVRISSNASRTLRYWDDYSNLFDEITISVHNEYANLDHIISVANLIHKKRNTNLYVFVLMDPFNWDRSVQCLEYLKNNSKEWFLSPQPVLFDNETRYNEDQKKYLEGSKKRECLDAKPYKLHQGRMILDNGQNEEYSYRKIILNNANQFYGYSCNLGIDRLYINIEGNVGGSCGQSILGGDLNIKDKDFMEKLSNVCKPTPVICQQKLCGCSAEIMIDKELI